MSFEPLYSTHVEVRYAETDAMGIVHHAVYPVWFELARVQFLRLRGLPYEALEQHGWSLPVIELLVKYHRPARFGDTVDLQLSFVREGAVRFRFAYRVLRGDELLITGSTLHGVTSFPEGKPTRPPAELLQALSGPGSLPA